MKKSIFSLLALLLATSILNAQKIKSDDIKGSLVSYPIIALPSGYNLYSVETIGDQQKLAMDYKIENVNDCISLRHFTRTEKNGDIKVKIIISNQLYQYNTNKATSLDALRGVEKTTSIDYALQMGFEITDKQNIVIQREFISSTGYFTSTLGTPEVVRTSVPVTEVVKSVNQRVTTNLKKINKRIQELIDIRRTPERISFYVIKPSKTETFDEYQTVVSQLEKVFSDSTKAESFYIENAQQAIDFWIKQVETFDVKTEEGLAYNYLCNFDIASAYMMVGNYEKANLYAEKVTATGYKKGYTSLLTNQLKKLQKGKIEYLSDQQKADNNPALIYQKKEVAKESPGSIFEVMKKKPEEETEFMTVGFLIDEKSDTLYGKFIEFEKNLTSGKVLFAETGKDQKIYSTPFSNIRQVSTQGKVYYAAKGLRKAIYASPELIVMGDETNLLFIINNKAFEYEPYNKEEGLSPTNYKKKFAEVFKDSCPQVAEKSIQGEYEVKQGGVDFLAQAIKDFETTCGSKEYEKYSSFLHPDTVTNLYK